jgi:pimeloyl-ACP methyl ester carboxylesterase
VLLHGFAGSLRWWSAATPYLAKNFRVIRIDLPGHGGSEKHSGEYATAALARQVSRALDRLGIERCVVVGHSMGGLVAVLLADIRPGLVARLVLVDTPLEYCFQNVTFLGKLLFLPVVGPVMRAITPDGALRKAACVLFAKGFVPPGEFIRESRRMTWRSFKQSDDGQDRFLRGSPSPAERVTSLGIPIRVLWGSEDVLWPIGAARGYRAISQSEVITIPGAGHTPMVEAPQRTAELISEFATAWATSELVKDAPVVQGVTQ